jgi:uncharacterized damage-inducible protein DinB
LKKPELNNVPEWYRGYVESVPDVDLLEALKFSDQQFIQLIREVSNEAAEHRYAFGKWSIKDLILHITDAERVFAYRALRFARQDTTVLTSYDHNKYVEKGAADMRSKDNLLDEYQLVRQASISMYATFSRDDLLNQGKVGENVFSAHTLGFIIAGHQLHHIQIIKERYLSPSK